MSDFNRTVTDLSDEEYAEYERGAQGFEDVTDNTIEAELEMMFDAD